MWGMWREAPEGLVWHNIYKHDVMFCAELTTEQSHHYSARWCAVIRFKSIKSGVGENESFPPHAAYYLG